MVLTSWKSKPPLKPGILLLIYPVGSRHAENKAGGNGMTWAKTETKVSTDKESEELPRSRRMKGRESTKRAPAFYDSLVSFLCSFFTCKYIFSYTLWVLFPNTF